MNKIDSLFAGIIPDHVKHLIKPNDFTVDCKQHGLIRQHYDGGCYICDRELTTRKQQLEMRYNDRAADIPEKYHVGFYAHDQASSLAKKAAFEFYNFILSGTKESSSLILCGKEGGGKTHLACRIALMFMKNTDRHACVQTAKQIISEIKRGCVKNDEFLTEMGQLAHYARYPLLVIDEIDAVTWSEKDKELLSELIGQRYAHSMPLVVVSNRQFDDLMKFLGGRIASRLSENQFVAVFNGEDFRARNK